MWKIIEHKSPVQKQEMEVKILLREMAEYTYASYSDSFEHSFKLQVIDIPITNNFAAEHLFKVIPISLKSLEVWKLSVCGNLKTKMWTLSFCEEK